MAHYVTTPAKERERERDGTKRRGRETERHTDEQRNGDRERERECGRDLTPLHIIVHPRSQGDGPV
eukprot:4350942-Pyramimonas_sp.AAC.1